MQNKALWKAMNLSLLLLYAVAAYLVSGGMELHHPFILFTAFILGAHVLEIPVAFTVLAEHKPNPLKVIIGTILFGFTWWLPVKRGLYAA